MVGFGPRSALSEIVKTSVDRYIYTNEHGPGGYEPMKAALCPPLRLPPLPRSLPRPRSCRRPRCFDADARPWKVAVALVERALLQLDEAAPDEMVNASRLKERLIALDSAFDEKRFGPFSSLRAFLMSASGRVLDTRASAHGIQHLPEPGVPGFETQTCRSE